MRTGSTRAHASVSTRIGVIRSTPTISANAPPPESRGATRMSDSPEDVLRKAEALLARHRMPRTERQPAPPVDFPTLTEVDEAAPPRPGEGGVPTRRIALTHPE